MATLCVEKMYWEIYDDQESVEFDFVGYVDLAGNEVMEDIKDNLAAQVAEIKRKNGQKTEVRVYKK